MASTLFGLWTALVRVFNITNTSNQWVLAAPILGFYMFHVMRMAGIRFAYGYNMRASITLVITQAVLWCLWSFINYKKVPHAKWMVAGHIMLLMFSSLEVIDRPPLWGLFDTHAFWHLALNIIFFFWNRFYIKDALNYRAPTFAKSE